MERDLLGGERLSVSVSVAVFLEDEQGRLLFVQQAAERKGQLSLFPSIITKL